LQKWYCKNDKVKDYIFKVNIDITKMFQDTLWERLSMNPEKIILFRSIIDDLWKKNCTMWCGNSVNFEWVVNEMVKIFSK
jgi:hypothetical protein